MYLTIDALFQEPAIINAIIDRTLQTSSTSITHTRYLKYHDCKGMTFKTYIGTVSRVRVGSMIDQYAPKPTLTRPEMGTGVGELGTFGDQFQMNSQNLDDILLLIDKYNQKGSDQASVLNEIVEFLIPDMETVLYAPMLALDKLMGDARSKGIYEVNVGGAEAKEITLPVRAETASTADINSIVSYLDTLSRNHRNLYGNTYTVMQMNSTTFRNKFMKSAELQGIFSTEIGKVTSSPTPLVPVSAINDMLQDARFNFAIDIDDQYLELSDGSVVPAFADNKIALLPSLALGNLEYNKDSDWRDKAKSVDYTEAHNGGSVLIGSERTKNGRFLDYKMNAAPNILQPQKMAIIDVSASLS